jgi:hypothetical protein
MTNHAIVQVVGTLPVSKPTAAELLSDLHQSNQRPGQRWQITVTATLQSSGAAIVAEAVQPVS